MHSTTGDIPERIRSRLEQSSGAFAEIDAALDGARFSATSRAGQVVATADRNGRLVSLEFVGVALTRVPAVELARQVVAAVNQAQADAGQALLRMVVDRLGPLPAPAGATR